MTPTLATAAHAEATPRLAVQPPVEAALRRQERLLLAGVLLVALLHGLMAMFLMPPWQHYEEPSHFEFAWIISRTGRLPDFPAIDADKRREIAASMLANGFYRDPESIPDLTITDRPINIGANVSGGVPLYHILAAGPIRLASAGSVEAELYAARLLSLTLFVLTVGLSYWVVGEITPLGHALRWAVPAALALIPGFVDLMTAVNNDVGATFMFTFYLWSTTRLIVRGLTPLRVLGVLVLAGLCALTKNTVLLALPLAAVAVVLAAVVQRRGGRLRWPAGRWLLAGLAPLMALGVLAASAALAWGDAALWYRDTHLALTTRVQNSAADAGRLGQHALALTVTPGADFVVRQPLPRGQADRMRGQTVTLGAWIWAERPASAYLPGVAALDLVQTKTISVTTEPRFYAWPVTVPDRAQAVTLVIYARVPDAQAEALTVYYDGIVLVEGARPAGAVPEFGDASATGGMWAGQPFTNLARNASAESAWLWVRPWADSLGRRVANAHIAPSTLLAAVLDVTVSKGLYWRTAVRLVQTFWGYFAWGSISLGAGWYDALTVATALGLAAAAIKLAREFAGWPRARRAAVAWLGLTALLVWGVVFSRGLFSVFDPIPYVPTARYVHPVIVPTVLALVAGWRYLAVPARLRRWRAAAFWAGLLVLNLASVHAIFDYYSVVR